MKTVRSNLPIPDVLSNVQVAVLVKRPPSLTTSRVGVCSVMYFIDCPLAPSLHPGRCLRPVAGEARGRSGELTMSMTRRRSAARSTFAAKGWSKALRRTKRQIATPAAALALGLAFAQPPGIDAAIDMLRSLIPPLIGNLG